MMIDFAPLGFERYSPLYNPLLIEANSSSAQMRQSNALDSVSSTAHAHQNYGSGGDVEQRSHNRLSGKNGIHLKNKVGFSKPEPETGRGQNIDIWA